MRRLHITVAILTLCLAAPASAQIGRAMGVVRDTGGRPIKGATVKASNPDAAAEFTSSTDDKGRFVMIGLRSGAWKFVAEAPGYFRQEGVAPIRAAGGPPLEFTLARDPGPIPGALVKDIQQELDAAAALRKQGRYDQAISAYQVIQAKNAKLTSVNLVLAGLYREKAQQEKDKAAREGLLDRAIAAYTDILKDEPGNPRAIIELAMTRVTGGDYDAAEAALTELSQSPAAGSDVFYSLGEVKFIKGDADGAEKMYERALEIDSTWLRPRLKLGLLAFRRGDQTTAIKVFEGIVAAAPDGPDAAEAAAYLKELKK
jgi:tetratricopeptide (TPR) repeat protein